MKKHLMNPKIQRAFFPIAFFCIAIVFVTSEKGMRAWWIYALWMVGLVFFLLDRIFKPWKWYRLEKRKKKQEEQTEKE